MENRFRVRGLQGRTLPAFPLFLPLILMLCAAGCTGKYFKDVRPEDKAEDVPFIPTFSWEAKQQVADLTFELYRATDFDVEAKQPRGEPLLHVSGFPPTGGQEVRLSDVETLRTKLRSEGLFLTSGYDALKASEDYVWVLRGMGPKEPFVEVYRFRTRRDYLRPD